MDVLPNSNLGTCDSVSCNGVLSDGTLEKCNEVLLQSSEVPLAATSITLQIHDGKISGE